MSHKSDKDTKSKVKQYEADVEKKRDAVIEEKHANLRARQFRHPEHVMVDTVHPTGNPNMYSPTAYVPVPTNTKFNLPKKHGARLPNPTFQF